MLLLPAANSLALSRLHLSHQLSAQVCEQGSLSHRFQSARRVQLCRQAWQQKKLHVDSSVTDWVTTLGPVARKWKASGEGSPLWSTGEPGTNEKDTLWNSREGGPLAASGLASGASWITANPAKLQRSFNWQDMNSSADYTTSSY